METILIMKITTFNPQIFTKNPEPIIDLFESLGFEKRHDQNSILISLARMLNFQGI